MGAVSVREETRNSFDESDGELSVAEPQRENSNSFDIPIFTEEFLDHNKARELELKQLRKQTGEFEEQNAVLGKHIESMKSAITKLEVETFSRDKTTLLSSINLINCGSLLWPISKVYKSPE